MAENRERGRAPRTDDLFALNLIPGGTPAAKEDARPLSIDGFTDLPQRTRVNQPSVPRDERPKRCFRLPEGVVLDELPIVHIDASDVFILESPRPGRKGHPHQSQIPQE